MRVLLMPSSYPPVLGGVQTVAHTLAQHLAGSGHAVRVITNRYPRSLPRSEERDGVGVDRLLFLAPSHDLVSRRPDLLLASLYYGPTTLARLCWWVRQWRPDVVNVHFPDAQVPFVLFLRRRFRFRLVVSVHGHDVERLNPSTPQPSAGALRRGAARLVRILHEADAVTACSQYLLSRCIELVPDVAGKGDAIHNGVDISRFGEKDAYRHPRPYILACGRLVRNKGFDILLNAFACTAELDGLDLIIAGEGDQWEQLLRLANDLGVAGRVHFTGKATPQHVVLLLNGCRFVVVPSRQESFGIVALEALAAGKPVVATRVGGMAEFLGAVDAECQARRKHSGILMVEPTPGGLSGGMLECERRLQSGQPSGVPPEVLSRYSWSHVVERYGKVLMATAGDARVATRR